jgi:hypothetical protein
MILNSSILDDYICYFVMPEKNIVIFLEHLIAFMHTLSPAKLDNIIVMCVICCGKLYFQSVYYAKPEI